MARVLALLLAFLAAAPAADARRALDDVYRTGEYQTDLPAGAPVADSAAAHPVGTEDIVADGRLPVQRQRSWYTVTPPTTVNTGFACRISSGATASRSRSHTTRSASLPGSSVPFASSWNSAYALAAV
jgi:hypothetical protein